MSAATWSDGYVTEIDYTYGYYREMAPSVMRLAMLSAGLTPPDLSGEYHYCELGFGQGAGLNLLAAANPRGQFYGTDFNPSQVMGARQLADRAGLPNVHLFDDSFEDFTNRNDLPRFDIVALHGIYSWVSPANRGHIARFLDRHLKPGGVAYVSYNSLPGWTPMLPIQWLMNRLVDRQTPAGQPVDQRMTAAMDSLRQLAAQPTGYFKANPVMAEYLEKLRGHHPNYLVHEYLNREWHPLHFMDVAQELEAARLNFACSADVGQMVDGLHLARSSQAWLASVADPLLRQQLRDYLTPTRFRRDLFARGTRSLVGAAQMQALGETPIALVRNRASCVLEASTGAGHVQLKPEMYNPLLDALAGKVMTVEELGRSPALRAPGVGRVMPAVMTLISVGYVVPGLPASAQPQDSSAAQRLNALLCREAQTQALRDINFLASPMLGGAVSADMFARTFADWCSRGGDPTPQACTRHALAVLRSQGRHVTKDGKRLDKPDEIQAELMSNATAWLEQARPLWQRLGLPA